MQHTDLDIAFAVDPSVDPALDPRVRSFLNALNSADGPPMESLSPAEARQVLEGAQASPDVDLSGIEVTDRTISSDGYTIDLNIVRPEGATGKLPVFVFIHGGGWVLGDFPTHKRMVRDLVVHSGFAAVFVNYTRSPEAQYPQAVNEVYAAVSWVAQHGDEIDVDGTNLAVVGNSAGGNLAATTTLLATERNGPKIKFQILFWPVADAGFDTGSYQRFSEKRFLTAPMMRWFYDLYAPEPERRTERYASPLQATVEQLRNIPPTLIQTAENDVLRDEGEAYGRKLAEAGVDVTTVRYNGTIHDFGLLNGIADLPAVRSLFLHAAAELRYHLMTT